MRANPHLLRGLNKLWIRFFILAVYATMYVRDHTRPMLHHAMGLDSDEYDYTVFRITTEISRQVFPLSLDTDHPEFRAGLEKLFAISQANERAKARGGVIGALQRARWAVAGAATFVRLYFMPVQHHSLPTQVRMVPAW
jgi:magnesium-protoporphyrin IX monomethyl ester (oxidative) cyclase